MRKPQSHMRKLHSCSGIVGKVAGPTSQSRIDEASTSSRIDDSQHVFMNRIHEKCALRGACPLSAVELDVMRGAYLPCAYANVHAAYAHVHVAYAHLLVSHARPICDICFAYAPPFFACAAGPEFLRGVGELCDAQPQPRTTASGRQVAPASRFADLPSTTEHNRILRSLI